MMKILLTLAFVALATAASAQQRTIYDGRGNVAGRASTDSQGATSVYDSAREAGRQGVQKVAIPRQFTTREGAKSDKRQMGLAE